MRHVFGTLWSLSRWPHFFGDFLVYVRPSSEVAGLFHRSGFASQSCCQFSRDCVEFGCCCVEAVCGKQRCWASAWAQHGFVGTKSRWFLLLEKNCLISTWAILHFGWCRVRHGTLGVGCNHKGGTYAMNMVKGMQEKDSSGHKKIAAYLQLGLHLHCRSHQRRKLQPASFHAGSITPPTPQRRTGAMIRCRAAGTAETCVAPASGAGCFEV